MGKGQYATVLKAHDYKYDIDVAIKIFTFEKFALEELEIYHLITCNTTNPLHTSTIPREILLPIETVYFHEKTLIILPLLSGDLYEYMQRQPDSRLSLSQVKSVAEQIIIALSFLHGKRIVHNDLK
jgi:serine/threonine protein kinase